MREKQSTRKIDKGGSLLLSIILVFCVLGAVVFSVSRKISVEMSDAAIQNLTESLNLIKSTIEAIQNKDAEFQKLMAQEIALAEDPEEDLRAYGGSQTMVKISLISAGETEGISDDGEAFTEEGLDFTGRERENGVTVSQSYVNYMGTWAYTMKCPVERDGEEVATLYVEYTYDSLDRFLPDGFYNKKAKLYIMDAKTERLVLKPKGMGERDAGHLNLKDFYRANQIQEESLLAEVDTCLAEGRNIMFYHDIRGERALNYMWSVNGGTIYLIGYVPIEAIQQEGATVNQNILIVVAVMLIAFFLCCILYYFNQRQQIKIRKEREAEREVHNRQLAEALQAAQAASNSKTTFLSNMSHDIRTPMNAVLGFATLLERDAENPDKVREYTKKIMASGHHLLSLINDILDVSKIESGKVVLSVEEFTLNDLVSSVDAIIRPMAKAREQKFSVTVTGVKHEYLMGDETRVNQILINLLSNAVKYTQTGGNIWFRIIGLGQRSSQFEHIRMEVEDNGYGMTPEYLKTIFDAFTRAENSTTNKVQGTGLGMAITKNIVELMGGTIEVSSEVDRGSLFRVELEFRIPERQADRQFWKESGISGMLVVDGGPSGENIQALMRDMEVAADRARSVREAMELVRSGAEGQRYQLVLLDWEIPDLDADRAAEGIRTLLPQALIVFLTESEEEDIQIPRTEKTGMIPKPFFVSALKEKVAQMQGGGKAQGSAEEEESGLEGLNFLAVEDNEINAEILREILAMEGASYELVENGQQAVERFLASAEGEFDAILMDVQMPVMNGYDATRAIRALERGDAGQIPIIAMTANAFVEDEKEALNAGMNVHLAKPVDVELLRQILKEYVKKESRTGK
ncbi:MAG: response regulator [Lachnospiraceae bacterium]|uniref:hybrid sensor histidine kinase/response regulator n=2 Tax=uncultured Acetatifactor sp. TaxID=1671927 RepID=UPI002605EBF5|nr:response regulator [uncultured Acetatifactor sp.]MCI8789894.1 response regulator [Lachnospiraceae bacterium]